MITFELEQDERDKKLSKLYNKEVSSSILIKKEGVTIGRVFTPSGSGHDVTNAIQVCGFTEAFDLWGCGIFKGYKDIQLLYDDGIMGGKPHKLDMSKCCRCYMNPCQCENKCNKTNEEIEEEGIKRPLPFNVKISKEIEERLERNKHIPRTRGKK